MWQVWWQEYSYVWKELQNTEPYPFHSPFHHLESSICIAPNRFPIVKTNYVLISSIRNLITWCIKNEPENFSAAEYFCTLFHVSLSVCFSGSKIPNLQIKYLPIFWASFTQPMIPWSLQVDQWKRKTRKKKVFFF